jgi:hypothetical protein
VEEVVQEYRVQYECLYHQNDTFDAEYGVKTVEDKLKIIASMME